MDRQRLLELVGRQDSLRREVMKLRKQDPEDLQKYHLYNPAEDAEIERFERATHTKYPESYRQFLTVHNGWLGFWPDWSLMGVQREENKLMFEDVKLNFDLLPDVVGANELEALSEKEKDDPKVIRLDRHIVIGTDFNGSNFEDLLVAAIEHTRKKRESLGTGH
jgi:hypothetical protein